MAGTSKGWSTSDIIQGPGEVWVIGSAPSDTNVRLTLASDGTPDATAHPGSVHLGAIQSAITTSVMAKMSQILLDQYDGPFDSFVSELTPKIEAEMAQTESQKLQRMLGVGAYSTGAGYKQVTFGGLLTVPKTCIAVISPTKAAPNQYIVGLLYLAVATGGFQVSMGRAKQSSYKASFEGMSDLSRTAGKMVGVIYQTLADAVGGTPTAKDVNVAEIYQGPAALFLVSPAPTDAAMRVTLDATTLTPDSTAHGASSGLGLTTGPVDFTVTPKLSYIKADQADAPIDVFIASLEAKIEAEMSQSSMDKLATALAVGNYTLSAGAYAQTTFGGTNQPPKVCVAAIGNKRSDPTKAVVACLYNVNSVGGITWLASRQKQSTYKLNFTGLIDPTRTAGRQMGIFHEMI